MVFFGDLPAEGARRASAAHGRSWAVACGFLGDTAHLTWSQPASGHVTCDDLSSQERLSGSSRVASFAPRHTPTLSLISPSRSATHTHLCGGHKSKTHELRGSPQFETNEIPTRALWTEAKATSREVQFRRSFLLGGHKHKEQTLFHSGRDALHMTTAAAGRRQARLDHDQHAAAMLSFSFRERTRHHYPC